MSMIFFNGQMDLSKELNCSWGNKEDLHLLQEDLSIEENLTMAMNRFPILKKLIKEYKIPLQEIERCRNEYYIFNLSEGDDLWMLKEFFRHWLMKLH